MKSLGEIKLTKENQINDLIKSCLMFFAFSNEQFQENKTPLAEGEKYVSLGAGAYMPKSKLIVYQTGIKEIEKNYRKEIKESKQQDADILYELKNHETIYTGDIDEFLEIFGDRYTREEVKKVFNENS